MTLQRTSHDLDTLLEEGIRLFNAGEYFETHEVLERAWRTAEGDTKRFLKGLIHAAVALYQYQRQNRVGALHKLESTHHYLGPYAAGFASVDVQKLLDDLDAYFATLVHEDRWNSPQIPAPVIRT